MHCVSNVVLVAGGLVDGLMDILSRAVLSKARAVSARSEPFIGRYWHGLGDTGSVWAMLAQFGRYWHGLGDTGTFWAILA